MNPRSLSLRTRVTWAAGLAAAIVVVLLTAVFAFVLVRNEDRQLDRRVDAVAEALSSGGTAPTKGRGFVTTIRSAGGGVESSPVVFPPLGPGFVTVALGGVTYRVRTVEVQTREGALLSVGVPVDRGRALVVRRALVFLGVGGAAVALSAFLGWLFAGRAVRPLRLLTTQTRLLASSAGSAVPQIGGAREVEELANAIGNLWTRLTAAQIRTDAALESARGFAAAAVHELRTPLTAMRTDLDMVRTHRPEGRELDDLVSDLIRTQRRVESTVTALGQLAAGELMRDEDRTVFELGELLDRVAQEQSRIAPGVNITVAPTASAVAGWSDGIRMALDNLVRNAIEHGSATVVVLSVLAPLEDGMVGVVVDDNGCGLPQQERETVLEKFRRGSTARVAGSGLGLALVVQQAHLHGGSFRLADGTLGGLRAVLFIKARPSVPNGTAPPSVDTLTSTKFRYPS